MTRVRLLEWVRASDRRRLCSSVFTIRTRRRSLARTHSNKHHALGIIDFGTGHDPAAAMAIRGAFLTATRWARISLTSEAYSTGTATTDPWRLFETRPYMIQVTAGLCTMTAAGMDERLLDIINSTSIYIYLFNESQSTLQRESETTEHTL